jgi:hypothetical protein
MFLLSLKRPSFYPASRRGSPPMPPAPRIFLRGKVERSWPFLGGGGDTDSIKLSQLVKKFTGDVVKWSSRPPPENKAVGSSPRQGSTFQVLKHCICRYNTQLWLYSQNGSKCSVPKVALVAWYSGMHKLPPLAYVEQIGARGPWDRFPARV